MTSVVTNSAAMTALRTLQATNASIADTQGHISTGYRVAEAKDNAAYWSIATTMRSDAKSIGAVQDALGISSAIVDTAYTGLVSIKDALDEIKSKMTAAAQEGVDKSKIQDEIAQLQDQIRSIADSASFAGQNWLVASDGYSSTNSLVSSFSRNSSGDIAIGSIDVDLSGLRLFDDRSGERGSFELLDGGSLAGGLDGASSSFNRAVAGDFKAFTLGWSTVDGSASEVSFDIVVDGGASTTISIDASDVLAKFGPDAHQLVANVDDFQDLVDDALSTAGVTGVTTSVERGELVFTSDSGGSGSVAISNVTGEGSRSSIKSIDITRLDADDIADFIVTVDNAISDVVSAAATLGAVQNRIDMQTEFLSKLTDTIDTGVGILVDAEMTEESTRLKALQTQQQLGVQALSIANNEPQVLLSLFR